MSWESKKADEILVRDIIDIKTEGTGKSGESDSIFPLHFLPFLPNTSSLTTHLRSETHVEQGGGQGKILYNYNGQEGADPNGQVN